MNNKDYANKILRIIGNVQVVDDNIYKLAYDTYVRLGGIEILPTLDTIYKELKAAIEIYDNTPGLTITENGTYTLFGKTIDVSIGSGPEPIVPPNNEIWYTSVDGNITQPTDTSSLPTILSNTYENDKGIIKFNSSLLNIGDNAFFNNTKLVSVTLPNSVTSIYNRAFGSCLNLESINTPESLNYISGNPFYGNNYLPIIDNIKYADKIAVSVLNLLLASNNIKIGTVFIGNSCFRYSLMTSCFIPDGVKYITTQSFYNLTLLKSVVIPKSIIRIETDAFGLCFNLDTINYLGTMAEWNQVTLETNWVSSAKTSVVHCTDGDVAI